MTIAPITICGGYTSGKSVLTALLEGHPEIFAFPLWHDCLSAGLCFLSAPFWRNIIVDIPHDMKTMDGIPVRHPREELSDGNNLPIIIFNKYAGDISRKILIDYPHCSDLITCHIAGGPPAKTDGGWLHSRFFSTAR
jgi:hypothetical protein